ncbi:nucleotide-binding alpha-beta plait domain-containing protein [Tanacetum coccineum]
MGNYRTKEDDVAKISTLVYVTNFPEYTSARELAQACKQYGHVIDTFIPNKKSKFGFTAVEFMPILVFKGPKGRMREEISFLDPLFFIKDNTFTRIANKWGKLLDVDNEEETCFHSKRLCIQMKSSKRINEEFKIIHCGKSYWIRAMETPGWVPDFADDIDEDDVNSVDEEAVEQKHEDIDENGDEDKVADTLFDDEEVCNVLCKGKTGQYLKRTSEFHLTYTHSLIVRNSKIRTPKKESDGSLVYPPGFVLSVYL